MDIGRHAVLGWVGAVMGVLAVSAAGVVAQVRLTGSATTELRAFLEEPQYAGQRFHALSTTLAPRLEITLPGRGSLQVEPFLRTITNRGGGAVTYFRSLAWSGRSGRFTGGVGIRTVRWGVARAASSVDILNQKDRSFHPMSNARVGQPMLSAAANGPWGRLDLIVMSHMRPRLHVDRANRLRGSLWVEPGEVSFGSGAGDPIEVAARLSGSAAGLEWGVSLFDGTGRDPTYLNGDTEGRLRPRYESLRQVAFDGRLTRGAWAVTSEATLRSSAGARPFLIGMLGLTRSTESPLARASVTLEYVRDSRGPRATSLVDDDFYLEGRLVLDDGRLDMAARLLIDRRTASTIWTASAWMAASPSWSLGLSTWQFEGADLRALGHDGYLSLSLRRRL